MTESHGANSRATHQPQAGDRTIELDHRVPLVPEDIRQRMANAVEEICAPIGNTYGTPTLTLSSAGWTLGIRDWDGFDSEPVSEQFAAAWIAEFGGPK
jgi:hypothetical protein